MKRIFVCFCLFSAVFAYFCLAEAAVRIRAYTSLTGGTTGCLDKTSSTSLNDGDGATVYDTTNKLMYDFKYNSSGTAAEDSPDVVRPDNLVSQGDAATYPGNWELMATYEVQCVTHWFENPTATDDFESICKNDSGKSMQIVEICGESDQDVDFDLEVDDGSPSGVNGSYISVSAGETCDATFAGDTEVADGEDLDLDIDAVASSPTWFSYEFCFYYKP